MEKTQINVFPEVMFTYQNTQVICMSVTLNCRVFLRSLTFYMTLYSTGGKHRAQGPNVALHHVLSGPAPCFYLAAVPSSHLTVKEYLYSPIITFGPLKTTVRLMWPPVKMSLAPLLYRVGSILDYSITGFFGLHKS